MEKAYLTRYLQTFRSYRSDSPWSYENGIVLLGAKNLFEATHDVFYRDFVVKFLDDSIDENGRIKNFHIDEYNIDNIQMATVLFAAYGWTKKEKFLKAIEQSYEQLKTHPRTPSGNFFHKLKYPNQVWLDGLYMGQPFYVSYGLMKKDEAILKDSHKQFANVREYMFDPKSGLYRHGYDESRKMKWSDPKTGCSQNVWSRAVGWYAMAMVDVYDLVKDHDASFAHDLASWLKEFFVGMLPWRDAQDSGMWYQVVDHPEAKGNYLETSGSLMLAYTLMKGARLGVLPVSYGTLGFETLQGTQKKYLKTKDNGAISLGGICQVAGLDDIKRDGSIAYYVSEPIAEDEAKGVAPLLMALAEATYLKKR